MCCVCNAKQEAERRVEVAEVAEFVRWQLARLRHLTRRAQLCILLKRFAFSAATNTKAKVQDSMCVCCCCCARPALTCAT